jgi:hypothetical protein
VKREGPPRRRPHRVVPQRCGRSAWAGAGKARARNVQAVSRRETLTPPRTCSFGEVDSVDTRGLPWPARGNFVARVTAARRPPRRRPGRRAPDAARARALHAHPYPTAAVSVIWIYFHRRVNGGGHGPATAAEWEPAPLSPIREKGFWRKVDISNWQSKWTETVGRCFNTYAVRPPVYSVQCTTKNILHL